MKTASTMSPRDWFQLALRIFGIYEVIVTVDTAVSAFNYAARLYRPDRTSIDGVITHLLASFLLAAWLLKAAPSIAAFFYPDPPQQSPQPNQSSSTTSSSDQSTA
jgi:hypothetical protein